MSIDIAALNASFAIDGVATIVAGNGGLPKVQVNTAKASGEIYLHGAQVTSWRPAGGEEVLFVSQQSRWEEGRAIRGGIPVCFPWFRGKADDPKAPAHGFARTRTWRLEGITYEHGDVVVQLATESDVDSHRWWQHDVSVSLQVVIGTLLELTLSIRNTGATAFQFEEALHTYHRVSDATQVRVTGLDGVTYLDNMNKNEAKVQDGDVVLTTATDNAYLKTTNGLLLTDPGMNRRLAIGKQGSNTTVVWNPWDSGAHAMSDLGDEEWRQMICVEACNILEAAVTLAPGEVHIMQTTIGVQTGVSD